jgi:hypothetical protein
LAHFNRLAHLIFIQRFQFLALVVHTPLHFQAQVTRHKGFRLGVVQIVQVGTVGPPNFQYISEPFGGNQGRFGSFTLGQGVDDNGRAMHKKTRIGDLDGQFV